MTLRPGPAGNTELLPHTPPAGRPMTADELSALPVRALAAALRRGELSSEVITRAFLDRIEALNPKLNAVVHLRADAALAEARTAHSVPAAYGCPPTFAGLLASSPRQGVCRARGTS
jgi:hypothetical protein